MKDVLVAHLLHLVAIAGVRIVSPERAGAAVRSCARWFVPLDAPASRHVAALLAPFGTCLTRSLVAAARLPGSTVVLGVEPGEPLAAHAWVEICGRPLRGADAWTGRLACWPGSGYATVITGATRPGNRESQGTRSLR